MSDFDSPPVYDHLTNRDGMASSRWEQWFTTSWQNLVGYLSSSGIFIPQLTTAQRDALLSITNGQMIYNTTLDVPQIVVAGIWKTIQTI